jgi:uncharacterized membrane protein YbhN (UPF0104 family)
VNKRLLLDLGKYLLAVLLLAWVVRANWAPSPTRAVATLGASTIGLCASPNGTGPLLAAATALPDRTEPRGLGYVWQRHVVQGQPVRVGFLVAAFLIYLVATLITLFRWYLLVRALDLPIRVRDALRYGMIGIFFNTFLPGSVGGDIIKAAALARTQSRRTAAVATVLMDRIIALWALIWLVALLGGVFWLGGMLTGPSAAVAASIVSIALIIVAVTAGIWLLLGLLPAHRAERFADRLGRLPFVGASAAELWRSVWMYRQRQAYVALVMGLSWVGQVGFVVAFFCCASALWSPELGPIPSLTQHFLLVPIGLVMQAVVPTPGGAGAGEWGFAALYLLFSAAEANGVLGSLVQRMITWILGLIGYAVYLWMRPGLSSVQATPADSIPVEGDGSTIPGAASPVVAS